jgi:uncharacterized protein YbjT (DUF2867 family)
MTSPQKTALLVGASGLVGSFCLDILLQAHQYSKVISVGRKVLPVQHAKLQQLVIDFDQFAHHKQSLTADDIYCCLGTTIKKAGSRDNFYKVDFTYVTQLATMTSANYASQFLVVSSLGANADSTIFYSRVKGQMENAVKPLPFLAVHIFQPSLLLGPRQEKRMGEQVASVLMDAFKFAMIGPLQKYKPTAAEDVAKAMVYTALHEAPGVKTHDPLLIKEQADLLPY